MIRDSWFVTREGSGVREGELWLPENAESKACVASNRNAGKMETWDRDVAGSEDHKTDWVSFMIKLLRAYGECLGARRR